jgi:hypothetical protein
MLSYEQSVTDECIEYNLVKRAEAGGWIDTVGGYWILKGNTETYQVYMLENREWVMYKDKFKVGEEEALRTWLELRYG